MFSTPHDFFLALGNLFVFFPYFFSVDAMVKTLFSPWKNVTSKKKSVGFSFNEWGDQLMFNLISRGIGFTMRLAILTTYLVIQILYIPFALVLTVFYFLLIYPFFCIVHALGKSREQRYIEAKQKFVSSHLLNQENAAIVDAWFDEWYQKTEYAKRWFELPNLLSIPPLARDWAQGYTPTLDKYAQELSALAMRHHARPMTIGREKEMAQFEQILCKSSDANVLLIGESGVGKTTIIESLAYRIYIGRGNPLLSFKRLLQLDLEKVLAQTQDQKQRELLLEELLKEAQSAGNVIIVIFDIDKYLGVGEGRVDLSTPLSKFLKNENVQVVGVTTPYNFQRYIFPHSNLVAHFGLITVEEMSSQTALTIIMEHAHRFENRYHVTIPYETLKAAVVKSEYFTTTIPFPEKALQLLDDCCVYVRDNLKQSVVTPDIVDTILSQKTHVPTVLTDDMKTKLLNLESALATNVIGQKDANMQIASAMRRAFLQLGTRKKPLASFLFLGPTGVGKTETAKTLASVFFNNDDALIRFDMSQFQSTSDIPKLIGDEIAGTPGLLISALREKPYGVLLLDEIEKAHPNLLNIFLTLLDEGYITDSLGKTVNCKSLVVIGTSNAGATEYFTNPDYVGDIKTFLIEKRLFSPEFLNRFDGVICFSALDVSVAVQIATSMVTKIAENIQKLHGVVVQVTPQTLQRIVSSHFNPKYGARDLERTLRDEIEDVVAKKLFANEVKAGDTMIM
jgi:ATP-dependent Clp protease ATP-binding subunit ClpC